MKDIVVNKIMFRIIDSNKSISKVKIEEIKYGLYGLYGLITKSLVIFLIAFILNIYKEFLIFIFFYGILRSVGYGCHAKTNAQCWIFSTVFLLGIPYLFSNINLSFNIKIVFWIILFINLTIFCPADTEKRPMISKKRKLKFKISIILISILYLFIIKYNLFSLSNMIIASMFLEGILVNPLGYILMGQKVRFKLSDINLFKQKEKEV